MDVSPTTLKTIMNGLNMKHNGYSQAHNLDEIDKIAAELAIDITQHVCGMGQNPINRYAITMRRCVEEMLIKHEYLFNGMVNKLHITKENLSLTFDNVVNELFKDAQINWGRIVSVYAFTGRLAQHLINQDDSNTCSVIHEVSEMCGTFVAEKLREWIEKHGGWATFEAHFPDEDHVEKTMWQGLLITAALSFGALATIVAVR